MFQWNYDCGYIQVPRGIEISPEEKILDSIEYEKALVDRGMIYLHGVDDDDNLLS